MEIGDEIIDGGVALNCVTPLNEVVWGEEGNIEVKRGWNVGKG